MTTPARPVSFVKDASGAPAVDLTKVREVSQDLAKSADRAGLALSKRDLSGVRMQVVALVDYSGSMKADYASGAVSTLLTRALGFALQVDADGKIPVIPFDGSVRPTFEVDQTNFSTAVDTIVATNGTMGSTNLAAALRELKKIVETSDLPVFAIIVTDGNPDDKAAATAEVIDLARYAAALKFLAVREVPYLSELDDLDASKRLVDNVDTKPEAGSGLNLLTCSDADFQDALADELDTWFVAAKAAGIIQ